MVYHARPALAGLLMSIALPMSLAAKTPDDSLIYGLSLAQVISLDPHQNADVTSVEIMANLYDRLLSSDGDGKLHPQLATHWEVTPESLTFHLNPEAKFTTGRKVTAEDVVFSLTRMVKLKMAVAVGFNNAGYTADNIDSLVHALDEHTFRLDLTGDIAGEMLLYRLAETRGSIVDREVVMAKEKDGDWGNDWLRNNSAGTGPFSLDRWSPNEMVIMTANEGYWDGAPELDRVVMRHIEESQVQRLMLERGDIDIAAALSASDIHYFGDKEGIEVMSIAGGGFYVLAMNMLRPELANPKVRLAIIKAINFPEIEKAIIGPYGRQRHVPVPVNLEGALPDPADWSYDPAAAKALLAEAGYPDGFKISIKTIAQTPRVDLATAIQAALTEIGIDIEVIQGAGADIVSMHRARDFDLLIPQMGPTMPNALGFLENFTTNPDNSPEAKNGGLNAWRSAWDIPEMHELTKAAAREQDGARRAEMLTKLQQLFIDSVPAMFPMYERFTPIAISERVEGYVAHPMNATRLEHVKKSD